MKVGIHTSVRHSYTAALRDAAALDCDTVQIFTMSPSNWTTKVFSDGDIAEFKSLRESLKFDPVVVHSPYLPNLCSTNEALYARSRRALREDLARCEKLGANYLVIHPGAYSPGSTLAAGLDRLGEALNDALESVPGRSTILIENMAGGGRRVGGTFQELADIVARVKDQSRVGVCFDTCHAFAAGHDLSSNHGVTQMLEEFDKTVGLERIAVFHVNDSRGPCASHRDLHEHIGRGYIGMDGLRALFGRPEFTRCALILETPKHPSPSSDVENLRRLRACLPPAALGTEAA